MTRLQRIILVAYCLALIYCCVWIPWRSTAVLGTRRYSQMAYSFLWAAPNYGYGSAYVVIPEVHLVVLRILAVSAVAAAAFMSAGFRAKDRSPH
jgi:hypothetical protein